ncbi:hypothetical protein GOP47_0015358 [Adiantum capillus-veneris]|uniref:GRDP C2 domain-containing protein n=1 Tax=Adiantum capillus-veneris TaxID=13818 RepID=A0A9D4UK99_ADICA|nr:hypothetical protein GOP47_0015358 [Adiantum capillus-veneris]
MPTVAGILWHSVSASWCMYRGEPPAPLLLPSPAPNLSFNANKPTTALGMPLDFTLLASRELMQIFVIVIKARNVPHKKKGNFCVRLQMERKCSHFKLETASVPLLSELAWNHTWTLEVEKLTNGLRLELL